MAEVDVREKTYTFLRLTLVALLVGLGVAVIWQTYRQGWQILDSVSAYYYTPAQPIFVGSLIGLGACMIALRGENTPEEVFLNLGGMFAAGVAVVPTSRGADYLTAIEACRQPRHRRGTDCPTVRALEQATRANIENGLVALLVVAALALAATWFLASRDTSPGGGTRSLAFRWGFWTSVAVVAVTAVLLVNEPGLHRRQLPLRLRRRPVRLHRGRGGQQRRAAAGHRRPRLRTRRWRAPGCVPASPRCGRRPAADPTCTPASRGPCSSLPSWA